jgi:hypothetical protein
MSIRPSLIAEDQHIEDMAIDGSSYSREKSLDILGGINLFVFSSRTLVAAAPKMDRTGVIIPNRRAGQ